MTKQNLPPSSSSIAAMFVASPPALSSIAVTTSSGLLRPRLLGDLGGSALSIVSLISSVLTFALRDGLLRTLLFVTVSSFASAVSADLGSAVEDLFLNEAALLTGLFGVRLSD